MSVLLLILGLILFVALVVVHEFGHYIAARRNGVEVEEFGIGFPPRAWGKKMKNKTLLSINWLPLGGFVKLKGEHDSDKEPGSYGRANIGAKTKIMMAGVVMNLLTAFVMLTVLAWVGMPQLVDNQFAIQSDSRTVKNEVLVGYVEPGSPAEKAGLQLRDQLLSIEGQDGQFITVGSADALPTTTKQLADQNVLISIRRDGIDSTVSTQLRSAQEVANSANTSEPKGYLGISPTEYTLKRSIWSAPIVALGLMVQFIGLTFQGLGHALSALIHGHASQASQQVAGPVGIFAIIKSGSLLGYQFVLMIIAIISLTLAIMNALPIPALDGGRLFVTYLYRLMRRPLTQKAEEWIHGTGFALLMLLFVLITVVDVKRFF